MNKVNIQLWIGNNFSPDEEYEKYFQQNEDANVLDLEYEEECPFLLDTGEAWYDPECIVIPERFASSQDIELVLGQIKVDEIEKTRILDVCKKLNISSANAFFWYVNNDLDMALEVAKPYKENYNGLKYIGKFSASSKYSFIEYGAEPAEQHLWIGTNLAPLEKYAAYFRLDCTASSTEDPDYKVCGFCEDIGIRWYDEDFIGYPEPLKKAVDIKTLLEKLWGPQLPCEREIMDRCHELGIEKANALFWFDASLASINKPYKDKYNGLEYIGKFKL